MIRTYIIAEAGVNHNGNEELALQLIDAAAASGADAVKFQTFKASTLATASAEKATYQKLNTDAQESQQAMLAKLELSLETHQRLASHCRATGITFLSTAFDGESLAMLQQFDMPLLKIPSGELSNGPLLWQFARSGKPLVVSTGMSSLGEIEQALAVIAHGLTHAISPTNSEEIRVHFATPSAQKKLRERVTLLHCTSSYPTPPEAVNLKAMETLGHAFGLPVGYSDHSQGIYIPVAAVARGAVLIEKHFTLDRTLPGPDHRASLEPAELEQMVTAIRQTERALGSGLKLPHSDEWSTRSVARQVLVAAIDINPGERLTPERITTRRAGTGISPMRYWDLLNKPTSHGYRAMEPLDE